MFNPRSLPKEEIRRFVRTTPFSTWEVNRLWKRFSRLDSDRTGYLATQVVQDSIHVQTGLYVTARPDGALDCKPPAQEMLKVDELKCNPFGARIVELFSEDGSGTINFQNFMNIFSVFSPRATVDTKMVWAFAIWDFDGENGEYCGVLHAPGRYVAQVCMPGMTWQSSGIEGHVDQEGV